MYSLHLTISSFMGCLAFSLVGSPFSCWIVKAHANNAMEMIYTQAHVSG
jgi:hypothetical protein